MPLYEYRCDACGQRFERIQKYSDPPPAECAKCGKGPIERLQSSPAFQFKGSGWYVTDYAQKGKSGGDGSSPASGEKKTETDSPSPAKSDSPAPSAPAKTPSET